MSYEIGTLFNYNPALKLLAGATAKPNSVDKSQNLVGEWANNNREPIKNLLCVWPYPMFQSDEIPGTNDISSDSDGLDTQPKSSADGSRKYKSSSDTDDSDNDSDVSEAQRNVWDIRFTDPCGDGEGIMPRYGPDF